jgi:hypothetical protein
MDIQLVCLAALMLYWDECMTGCFGMIYSTRGARHLLGDCSALDLAVLLNVVTGALI